MSWELVSLNEVCTPASSNLAQKDLLDLNGEYPVYGASGLIKNVDFYKQDKPYIAIVKDGAGVGRTMLLPAFSSVIGTLQYILPKPNVDIGYLYYSIDNLNLARYHTGATIPHIYFKDYKTETIPLPPLDVQRRISETLDMAQSLITARREQIATLDKLARDLFMDMFGDPLRNPQKWEVQKLKDITSIIQSGNTPKGGKKVYQASGIMFFRSQNVWRNRIELDDIAFIDEATHSKMKKTSLKYKDILITKTGRTNTENSSLGRASLFLGEDGSANINGHVYLVRLNQTVVPEFVLHILITNEYRDYIRKVCVGGIDKRQINKEHLEEFPIIMPPFELQTVFAERVAKIETQSSRLTESLAILESTYKSLLQEAFNGELFQ